MHNTIKIGSISPSLKERPLLTNMEKRIKSIEQSTNVILRQCSMSKEEKCERSKMFRIKKKNKRPIKNISRPFSPEVKLCPDITSKASPKDEHKTRLFEDINNYLKQMNVIQSNSKVIETKEKCKNQKKDISNIINPTCEPTTRKVRNRYISDIIKNSIKEHEIKAKKQHQKEIYASKRCRSDSIYCKENSITRAVSPVSNFVIGLSSKLVPHLEDSALIKEEIDNEIWYLSFNISL